MFNQATKWALAKCLPARQKVILPILNRVGYLRTLIVSVKNGSFKPEKAFRVADARHTKLAQEARLLALKAAPPDSLAPVQSDGKREPPIVLKDLLSHLRRPKPGEGHVPAQGE